MRIILLCHFFAFLPLLAEELNADIFRQAIDLADEAAQLQASGKTVKSEEAIRKAEKILAGHIKKDRTYTFPENCAFGYEGGQNWAKLIHNCEPFRFISFLPHTEKKAILRELQECANDCNGEFIFLQESTSKKPKFFYFNTQYVEVDQKINVIIKIRKVRKASAANAE